LQQTLEIVDQGGNMSWLKKSCVVVPIDFSEDSFRAAAVAQEFVEDRSDVHLIHVTQPWSEHELGGSWGEQTEEARIQKIKSKIQGKMKDTDYEDIHVVVRIGSPPVEITRYAKKQGAELIVMPSHGRTGIQHFTLGSVAERVIRKSHCPVLVLKKEAEAKQERKEGKSKKIISYD
jgi:nucleotide-binding universal stress UspA family protein